MCGLSNLVIPILQAYCSAIFVQLSTGRAKAGNIYEEQADKRKARVHASDLNAPCMLWI